MDKPFVDLMLNEDGTYACADWCETGRVRIRGNFCEECQMLERNAHFAREMKRLADEKRQRNEV